MWDLQQKVCLCDHDEETPRHPHRGEALGVRGMWKEVHTEGKPEGKSVELKLKQEDLFNVPFLGS